MDAICQGGQEVAKRPNGGQCSIVWPGKGTTMT